MTEIQIKRYNELKQLKDDIKSTLDFWEGNSEINVCLDKWNSCSHDFDIYPIYTDSSMLKNELDNLVYDFLKQRLEEVNKEIEMI